MKEIKTLMQELRQYPNHLFIYPINIPNDKEDDPLQGLVVCNSKGVREGYIELGDRSEVVVD